MINLTAEQYDENYFNVDDVTDSILKENLNGGYNFYCDSDVYHGLQFEKYAKEINDKLKLKDKKVLDLGCANGFLIKHLRGLGVNCL